MISLKEEHNFELQSEYAKMIIVLLKYSSKKLSEVIMKNIDNNYVSSKSYYERRLFIPMFEESLNQFSIEYLKNFYFINVFLDFFNNEKYTILPRLFKVLRSFFLVINSDKKIKSIITSRIDSYKKSKPKEREVVYVIHIL